MRFEPASTFYRYLYVLAYEKKKVILVDGCLLIPGRDEKGGGG